MSNWESSKRYGYQGNSGDDSGFDQSRYNQGLQSQSGDSDSGFGGRQGNQNGFGGKNQGYWGGNQDFEGGNQDGQSGYGGSQGFGGRSGRGQVSGYGNPQGNDGFESGGGNTGYGSSGSGVENFDSDHLGGSHQGKGGHANQQTPYGQGHVGHQGTDDKPGLLGKVKHAYEDIKGGHNGAKQQSSGGYGQNQGGGDKWF